jgi:hypothetical protein
MKKTRKELLKIIDKMFGENNDYNLISLSYLLFKISKI